ncbi:hypothetical protein ABLT15_33275 [Paraburkholderia tropica]|uniref:hypothetical protein n=1 Tax=Paraburkholderia tropica TaxID=92647 RepID=UPI0032B5EE3E
MTFRDELSDQRASEKSGAARYEERFLRNGPFGSVRGKLVKGLMRNRLNWHAVQNVRMEVRKYAGHCNSRLLAGGARCLVACSRQACVAQLASDSVGERCDLRLGAAGMTTLCIKFVGRRQ